MFHACFFFYLKYLYQNIYQCMMTVFIIMKKPFPQELNELANKHRETVAARRIQREWRAHHKEVERRHVGDLLFGLPGFSPSLLHSFPPDCSFLTSPV